MMLIQSVSTNRRTTAEQTLDVCGGGQLLVWDFDDTRLPPSWAMLRQANTLYFAVAGTANGQQWIGNITGIFPQPYSGGPVLAHSHFLAQAVALYNLINPLLPPDWRSCDLCFAGQSYGAMCAWLVSLAFKKATPAQRIEFMGFAMSKVLTDGFAGPFQNVAIALNNVNDAVPFVPPNGVNYWLFGPANVWRSTVPTTFRHYERTYSLDSSGNIIAQQGGFYDRDPTAGELASTNNIHPGKVYVQYTLAGFQALNLGSFLAGLVPLAQTLVADDTAYRTPSNFTWRTNVDANFVNQVLFQGQDGGVINPATPLTIVMTRAELVQVAPVNPILALPTEVFMPTKVQFFFLDGNPAKYGISDTWYLSATPDDAAALLITQQYLMARMPISGNNTLFDYARFSNVPPTRIVKTVTASQIGLTAPRVGTWPATDKDSGGSDFAGTCLECVKIGANGQGRLFLRGIPDVLVEDGGEYTPTPLWTTRFGAFNAWLTGNGYQFSVKGANVRKFSAISAITNPAPGNLQITLSSAIFVDNSVPPVPLAQGTKINATITGMTNNKQLQGPLVVVVDTTTTCHSLRPIAMSNLVLPPTATLSYYSKGPINLTSITVTRSGARHAGKPTKLVPGRRKNLVRG